MHRYNIRTPYFQDPRLLAEIHIALLKLIIKDIEDVARTPASAVGANPNVNPGGGHPDIVEGVDCSCYWFLVLVWLGM